MKLIGKEVVKSFKDRFGKGGLEGLLYKDEPFSLHNIKKRRYES